MNKFQLEIMIPEKIFFDDAIDSLIVETSKGKLGILSGHEPMVIALIPSTIVLKKDNQEMIAINGEGFVIVHATKTIIFCQTMQWTENKIKKMY